ncbi:hypothetical protein K435DRAFT_961887 [Dendrothele bispora CBS 962.96]|uniref:C2H2-type domain-containing protein n=1 Tax=Dendrothele bispora (strain CBS 962.96) TaxID=1314807 RepID=A0A4S8MN93_DENBC|nr:hypothetical protein K435DRAFT_961887 [Dendrothele bispora CBS 962.96]
MTSLSFRARPGAVVRVTQTVAGLTLRVEDSGSSTLNHHISNGSELDIRVDLNTTGLTISVIPASSSGLTSTEVSPQPQGIFNSTVSHWAHDRVWPSSPSDADSLLSYSEENTSTYSRSPNFCHSDILELNTLLSSLQTRSILDSASLDPIGLDIPSSVPGRRHSMPSAITTRNVNNMQDCSDAGTSESVQDNHVSVAEALPNLTFVSQMRNSQFPCRTCDRVFTREYNRKVHEEAHTTRAAGPHRPHRCREPNCNTTFSRSHDRLRHEVRIHGHEAHTCAICNNMFSSLKSLQKHHCKYSSTQS